MELGDRADEAGVEVLGRHAPPDRDRARAAARAGAAAARRARARRRPRGAAPHLGPARRAGGDARRPVIVTTHQPEEAEHCDRIAILDGGKLTACGTPDELRARVAGDVVRVRGDRPEELRDDHRRAAGARRPRRRRRRRHRGAARPRAGPAHRRAVPARAPRQPRDLPPDAGRRVRQADRPGAGVVIGTVAALAGRDLRRFFRQPSRVVGSAAQPLILWVVLGAASRAASARGGGAGVGYLQYFYPGIVVLTCCSRRSSRPSR